MGPYSPRLGKDPRGVSGTMSVRPVGMDPPHIDACRLGDIERLEADIRQWVPAPYPAVSDGGRAAIVPGRGGDIGRLANFEFCLHIEYRKCPSLLRLLPRTSSWLAPHPATGRHSVYRETEGSSCATASFRAMPNSAER